MGNDRDGLSPEAADDVMTYVMDYYLKHYDIVFKKLGHARDATKDSIDELAEKKNADAELKVAQQYDSMWDKVIDDYTSSGVSQEELDRIDDVLTKIPQLIKKFYEVRVQQDSLLLELVEKIQSPEYKKAIEITKKIQSRPDLLSGLDPDVFELEDSKTAFVIKPPHLRGTTH